MPIKELCSFTVKTSTPLFGEYIPALRRPRAGHVKGLCRGHSRGKQKGAEILAEDLRNKGFKADYQADFDTVPYGKIAVTEGGLSGGI